MPAIVIVGGQWGDEGKGKIVDTLTSQAHMVVRYSGGANSGHTVVTPQGEFRMHLVPSGILHPGVSCVIANGVVADPQALLHEIELLDERGVDTSRLSISERTHVVMPYHLLLDELEERARGDQAIGTTRKGIGPAYTDKAARLGIRMGDLLDKDTLRERLAFVLKQKNAIITKVYGGEPLPFDQLYQESRTYGERLARYICPAEEIIAQALQEGKVVLLEGAQGTLLDLDHGTYPYVTSSHPTVGGACVGTGIAPSAITQVIGVFKAYATRVGQGPLPTEIFMEEGRIIRERGQEFGTTTGRPRRCGWFDAVAARYSVRVNGITSIALTRLDVLDTLDSLKVCTAYTLDNDVVARFPTDLKRLERCIPHYEKLPGWKQPISQIRHLEGLPREAQSYAKLLAELLDCPISLISQGPGRDDIIPLRPLL